MPSMAAEAVKCALLRVVPLTHKHKAYVTSIEARQCALLRVVPPLQ